MPYYLFDTALGTCAIAWSEAGLTRVLLPGESQSEIEAHMQQTGVEPAETPLPRLAEDAATALKAFMAGKDVSFASLALDDSIVTRFDASIYRALQGVSRGTTTTYGDLARQVGNPAAARAVGVAMARNPWPVIVPCHRVLASGGKVGGFSAPGGVTTKRRLLAIEGVDIGAAAQPDLFDTQADV